MALADDDWESQKKDYDSSGEIHLTGIWEGENSAYSGTSIPVPSQFSEAVQRRVRHFEILLGLLKMTVHDVQAARASLPDCEAILAYAPDPWEPVDAPKSSDILARLYEERVHAAIVAVLDGDDRFRSLSPDLVSDEEIQSACLSVIATMDLSDAVGNAEFHAAMAAVQAAYRRLYPDPVGPS